MSDPQLSFAFRRPPPVVKATLVLFVVTFLVLAIGVHVSSIVGQVAGALVFVPQALLHRPWTAVTYPLVHSLESPWNILFECMAIYFFAPELEERWGGLRLVLFFVATTVGGALLAQLFSVLGIGDPIALGPDAICVGAVTAWGLMNRDRTTYFFFFPMKGVHLVLITIGFEFLNGFTRAGLLVVPAFGGIMVGAAWASAYKGPLHQLFLKRRLKKLEAERDAVVAGARRKASAAASGLRVIPGGKDDEGKRWMN